MDLSHCLCVVLSVKGWFNKTDGHHDLWILSKPSCVILENTYISMRGTAFFSSSLKSSHFQLPGFSVVTVIRSATACPALNEPIDTGASGQTEVEEKLRWGEMQHLWKKHWLHSIAWDDDGVWTESGVTAVQFVCLWDYRKRNWKATDHTKETRAWTLIQLHKHSFKHEHPYKVCTHTRAHTHTHIH